MIASASSLQQIVLEPISLERYQQVESGHFTTKGKHSSRGAYARVKHGYFPHPERLLGELLEDPHVASFTYRRGGGLVKVPSPLFGGDANNILREASDAISHGLHGQNLYPFGVRLREDPTNTDELAVYVGLVGNADIVYATQVRGPIEKAPFFEWTKMPVVQPMASFKALRCRAKRS